MWGNKALLEDNATTSRHSVQRRKQKNSSQETRGTKISNVSFLNKPKTFANFQTDFITCLCNASSHFYFNCIRVHSYKSLERPFHASKHLQTQQEVTSGHGITRPWLDPEPITLTAFAESHFFLVLQILVTLWYWIGSSGCCCGLQRSRHGYEEGQ